MRTFGVPDFFIDTMSIGKIKIRGPFLYFYKDGKNKKREETTT